MRKISLFLLTLLFLQTFDMSVIASDVESDEGDKKLSQTSVIKKEVNCIIVDGEIYTRQPDIDDNRKERIHKEFLASLRIRKSDNFYLEKAKKQAALYRESLQNILTEHLPNDCSEDDLDEILSNFCNSKNYLLTSFSFVSALFIKEFAIIGIVNPRLKDTHHFSDRVNMEKMLALDCLKTINPTVLKAVGQREISFFTWCMSNTWRKDILFNIEKSKRTEKEIVEFSHVAQTLQKFYEDYKSDEDRYTYNYSNLHVAHALSTIISCLAKYDNHIAAVIVGKAGVLFTVNTDPDEVVKRIKTIAEYRKDSKEIIMFAAALHEKVSTEFPKETDRDKMRGEEISKLQKTTSLSGSWDSKLDDVQERKERRV